MIPEIRFPISMLCPISFSPLSVESGGKGRVYLRHSPWTSTPKWVRIFAQNLNHTEKTSLETFWHTQVLNMKYLPLAIVLGFFSYFLLLFLLTFFCNPLFK